MQQVVGALGKGLVQIFRVKRLHIGIFVGEAQRRIVIEAPEDVSPLLRAFLAVVNGLSSAARAAAGTGHNLYEIIFRLSGRQRFEKPSRVSEAAGHRRADRARAGNVEARFLPALHAAHRRKRIGIRVLPVAR